MARTFSLAIRHLGTGWLPGLLRLQQGIGELQRRVTGRDGAAFERTLHGVAQVLPKHLPQRMRAYRDRFEHHLLLKMAGRGIGEARDYLRTLFPSSEADAFECTPDEAEKALLHRFVVAGAAKRYLDLRRSTVEDMVALDVAFRPDDEQWSSFVPQSVSAQVHTNSFNPGIGQTSLRNDWR